MKKNYQNITINILLMILLILMFLKKDIVAKSTILSTQIFLNKVFPYLFIMIIIENLIIEYNLISCLKSEKLVILFLFFIGGSPTSAILINNLLNQNNVTYESANKLLYYCYFSNPLFCYSILTDIFNDKKIVLLLIICHYLSNIILFLILKNKIHIKKEKLESTASNFGDKLIKSISKSINSNITVLGTIIFFMIITSIILPKNIIINTFLSGILELTQGLSKLSLIKQNYLKQIFALIFISFGGLCIHTQIYSCFNKANKLKYSFFLKGRIISTIIGIIIYIIITLIFI